MLKYGFIVQLTLLQKKKVICHNCELFYELLPAMVYLCLKCKYAA